jgi:REP element-mobilizing transposase RayT
LCGDDIKTGGNFNHRRSWIEEKLLELPKAFAINVAAYAVMHNHYHVVLHIDTNKAQSWTDRDVINRWHQVFKGTRLSRRFSDGDDTLSDAEMIGVSQLALKWRKRLLNISWFMRVINQQLARSSNKEDGCKGHFWESRFKSQALLDDAALLTCMAYVDLNPVRAKIAETPENSEYTSAKIRAETAKKSETPNETSQQNQLLLPFTGDTTKHQSCGIQFKLSDYFLLLDATGRVMRSDKRGAIDSGAECILIRLGIDQDKWLKMTREFEHCFNSFVGNEKLLRKACEHSNYQRVPGVSSCREMFR